MKNIALITSMIPPYRVMFYEEMAKKFNYTVIADRVNSKGRLWNQDMSIFKFDFLILNSRSIMLKRDRKDLGYNNARPFNLSMKVFPHLRALDPDVVITIEFGLKTLWSLLYAKLYGKKLILWSEGTLHTEKTINKVRLALRRFIAPRVDMFWTNGVASSDLVKSYGVAKNVPIVESMTGVNVNWWAEQRLRLIPQRENIREELGIQGKCILVNSSIIRAKGIIELMDALKSWNSNRVYTLLILGAGDLASDVEEWAKSCDNLHLLMPGFLEPEEMPRYMITADWAVLPTLEDNWPLAALEVLLMGVPQLFSCYNGGSVDLCEKGITGHLFDPLDKEDFVSSLHKIEAMTEHRISDNIVAKYAGIYSPEAMTNRAIKSIEGLCR